jgi:hypothetical protein
MGVDVVSEVPSDDLSSRQRRRTRTDSLYFSVTVFTTVGFGDIAARSEAARLVVTLQMLLDLLLLGLVVKLFFSAIKRSQQRHVAQQR